MPALRHLTINQDLFGDTEELKYALPTFSSLESLHIATDKDPDIGRAIGFLLPLTPNITSLTLVDSTNEHDASEGHLLLHLLHQGDSGPLLCKVLEELVLGGTSTPLDKLKNLVELRGPTIKKIY
ncbi:hypothetical protein FRC01_014590, partial [Tulasnella sp. 417]